MTAIEYYRRKRELEETGKALDRDLLRAQFALNEQMVTLEAEWDAQSDAKEKAETKDEIS